MNNDVFVEHFKLDVTVLGDRNRQVSFESDMRLGIRRRKIVTIWTRKHFLTENVYLEGSQSGELRVVKQIHHRDGHPRDCLAEVQALGSVSKDNGLFVQFLGWFQSRDHIFFAMEYCPLGDLSQCFQDPLSEEVVRSMCYQLLEGLVKLHDMKITHRDIKPQNILVAGKDPIWVKIGDFGISKRVEEGETDLRTRAGTDGYIAPEVLALFDDAKEDSIYTSAVDMWSLGCLLHYALTKKTPFLTHMSLRDYCRGKSEFPEASLIEQKVSSSGRQFIKNLVALQPCDRPKASTSLMSNWVIGSHIVLTEPPLRTESPTPTIRSQGMSYRASETSEPTTRNEIGRSAAGGTLGEPEQNCILQVNPDSDSDDMDFHSSELWHCMKDLKMGVERVRPLLEAGASPDKIHDGLTALHLATKQGPAEKVQILLEHGADVAARTRPHQETALHLATYDRNIEKLKLLVNRNADVNAQNADGDTTLHMAIARSCTIETVDFLITNGASLEVQGRNGRTPLQYAISLDREDKARWLLHRGANPSAQDNAGRTPLHQSISSKQITVDFIKVLVEVGGEVNQEDNDKHTPLWEAAKYDRRDVICFLVDHDANCQLGSSEYERRVQRAQFWRRFSIGLPSILGK